MSDRVPSFHTERVNFADIDLGQRRRRAYGDVRALADRISRFGLLHNIVVFKQQSGKLLIIAGGRRYRALELLIKDGEADRWNQLDVNVSDQENLTEYDIRALELEENLQRLDMTEAERLLAQKQLHDIWTAQAGGPKESTRFDAPGHSLTDSAKRLRKPKSTLSHEMKLAEVLTALPELAKKKDLKKKDIERVVTFMQKRAASAEAASRADAALRAPVNELQKKAADSFVVGDFFEKSVDLPSDYFDLIEIDWPYAADLNEVKNNSQMEMDEYNEIAKDLYPDFVKRTLNVVRRCSAKNAWLIVWFSPDPWFQLIADAIREVGFEMRALPCVWTKDRGQTMQPSRHFASGYEMFFIARKGDAKIIKEGRLNVFQYSTVPAQRKIHVTEKPVDMLEDLFGSLVRPGSRLLVPFAGSGASLLAAADLTYEAIGFDLSQHHRDRFVSERAIAGAPPDYKDTQREVPKSRFVLSAYEQALMNGQVVDEPTNGDADYSLGGKVCGKCHRPKASVFEDGDICDKCKSEELLNQNEIHE